MAIHVASATATTSASHDAKDHVVHGKQQGARGSKGTSVWWPRLRKWGLPFFGVLVLGLLLSHAHNVDWAGAWEALKRYPPLLLLAGLGIATLSHALYGFYDLVGKLHTRHRVPVWETWAIAVASYAFNLNLGSLVGGVAMRARLYTRAGLDEATIAQVVGLSLATNWLGYSLMAGGLFASGAVTLPGSAHIGHAALRVLGIALMLLAVAYVLVCTRYGGHKFTIRGRRIRLPAVGIALLQLALSTTNWALMGAVMYTLLRGEVPYPTVLGVLMTASIVGVVTPIPAGLGVLEAVCLALLSGHMRQGALMGAVLAYRALYYLLPLLGGIGLYAALERYATAHASETASQPPSP